MHPGTTQTEGTKNQSIETSNEKFLTSEPDGCPDHSTQPLLKGFVTNGLILDEEMQQ